MGYVCQKIGKKKHIDAVSCQIFPGVPDSVETKYDMPIFFSTTKQKRTSNLQQDRVDFRASNWLYFFGIYVSLQISIKSNLSIVRPSYISN